MDELKVKLNFVDSIKSIGVPGTIAIGLYVLYMYRNGFSMFWVLFNMAFFLGVIVLARSIGYLTINDLGFSFLAQRFETVTLTWEENVSVTDTDYKFYPFKEIIHTATGRSVKVPRVVFRYPEVVNFINCKAPKDHVFRELVKKEV